MYAVFLVFLVGGLVATMLLAALGGIGSQLHLHAGPMHAHLQIGTHTTTTAGGHAQMLHTGAGQPGAHLPAGDGGTQTHGTIAPAHAAGQQLASWTGAAGWAFSWLSPLTLAAAALGFGAAGLLVSMASQALAVPLAVAGALIAAVAVRALMRAFVRAETPALAATAEGAMGTINAPIREDRAGEVVYTLEGLQRSAPARTLDGVPLPRGARVVIVRRERGMAWVAPLDPLQGTPGSAPPPATAVKRAGEHTFNPTDAQGASDEQ